MSSNNTINTPHSIITPDNHGSYITITSALLLIGTVLVYFLRLTVRFALGGHFGSDDYLLTAGTILGFAQSVTVMVSVSDGLGRRVNSMSSNKLIAAEHTFYVSNLLYIATMTLAKSSASQLVARLTRRKEHTTACGIISAVIGLWGLASIFAIGIGCHPSRPWDLTNRCSNMTVSWDAIESIGILLEMALLFLPIYLVWDLQMSYLLKAMVLSAFAFRIPIIPLAIARIQNLNSAGNSTDYIFDVVLAVVFAQVGMHYSLIAATIPCARPFLKALNTGYMATAADQVDPVLREQNQRGDMYMLSSKGESDLSKSRLSNRYSASTAAKQVSEDQINTISGSGRATTTLQLPIPSLTSGPGDYLTSNAVSQVRHGSNDSGRPQSNARSDVSSPERLIIKKTVGYEVQVHDA